MGPPVAPTISGGRRGTSKLGDHADRAPSCHRDPTIRTAETTMATAQGRFRMLRSPLLDRKGADSRKPPIRSGTSKMTQVSKLGGMSASTAKYQSRYQSGRGAASVT